MPTSRVAETHISTVFFTGDRAYKLLKPVVNGFLDHRDTAVRIAAADREVDLNRRVAPDVYLGTADVIEDGTLVDRFIVMRSLPQDRSVGNLLRNDELRDDDVRAIARTVASFHASLPPIEPDQDLVSVHRARWTENFDELDPFIGTVLPAAEADRVRELSDRWLASHAPLLQQRVRDGWIRDGHGDLLAEDIFCVDGETHILDCLAFRDDFRVVDILDDIAFLALDLHRIGGAHWAQRLLHHYGEFSAEHHPGSLAHYYVAYRAHVRTKVACLRAQAGDENAVDDARLNHRLCLHHLERAQLRLILVGGAPATGKTTLAQSLGEAIAAPVLSTDELRKDMQQIDRTTHRLTAPDAGIYTPTITNETYDELIRQAELLLQAGENVVLDGSWSTEPQRVKARELARRTGAEILQLECELPLGIAKERLIRRMANPLLISDATPEIADHLSALREPWPDAISIDTNRPFTEVEAAGLRAFQEQRPAHMASESEVDR